MDLSQQSRQPLLLPERLSGGFEIYAQGQCTRIFLSTDGI